MISIETKDILKKPISEFSSELLELFEKEGYDIDKINIDEGLRLLKTYTRETKKDIINYSDVDKICNHGYGNSKYCPASDKGCTASCLTGKAMYKILEIISKYKT